MIDEKDLEFLAEHNKKVRENTIFDFLAYVREYQENIDEQLTFGRLLKIAKGVYGVHFITGERAVAYTDDEGQQHEAIVSDHSQNFRHYDIVLLSNGKEIKDVPVERLRDLEYGTEWIGGDNS